MSPSPSPSPSAPVLDAVTPTISTVASDGVAVRHDLLLYVNGERVHVPEKDVQPEQTLLQFLRTTLKLTGTKLGCGEGGCGACTVMVSKFDVKANEVRHYSVNSCLTPVCAMDTCAVTTVEGVGHITGRGTDATGLHPVQQALAESHGSQCGYCTPGFIMALYAMVKQRETGRHLTMEEIEHGMDGNLCRCTGYRPILDAAKSFGVDAQDSKCKGDCPGCPNKGKEPVDIEDMGHSHDEEDGVKQVKSCSSNKIRSLAKKWEGKIKSKPAAERESEFPTELQQKALQPEYLQINGASVQWFAPVTLPQLLALKTQHPDAKISVGNTEMGIETKFKHLKYVHLINVNRVPELVAIDQVDGSDTINQSGLFAEPFEGVKFGAAVTLTEVKDYLSSYVQKLPSYQTHTFTSITRMLKWFASTHIRNVACLAGNIVTASPISDMNPLLAAMNAYVELRSAEQQTPRYVCVRDFFLAYRKVDLAPTEVITNVYVPFTKKWEYMLPFKQAKRREDDISIVTSGIRVKLAPGADAAGWVITDASLVYGGMAPLTKAAAATEQFLIGQPFNTATIDAACDVIHEKDFILPAGVPGGMARYRESLCASFLYKFLIATTKLLEDDSKAEAATQLPAPPAIAENELSAGESFVLNERESSRGMQAFGLEKGGMTKSKHTAKGDAEPEGDPQGKRGPVGDSLMHKSAYLQVTGEAIYTDDIPTTPDTVHGVLVLSTHAHALIKSIDATEALGMEGVRGFIDASVFEKHHLGSNTIGAILKDEECFATKEVVCVGQPVGMIVADSHEIATEAAEKVKVVYEELPSIITIQDAIKAQSFFPPPHVIDDGNIEEGFAKSETILEGEFYMGGQEQFYFETNVSLCTPTEGGMKVVSSTQAATKAQTLVARVLGIHESRVVSTAKRIGGGFGGKETRSVFVSCAAAVAAKVMRRPVKCLLERHVDMLTTGGRHPFYSKYKVGVNSDGLIQALEVDLYNNAGYSLDLSMAVMDRALFHCDNSYKIPHLRATGRACKTNMPTNTAFRGFGGPQGLVLAETYIDHIARALKLEPEEVRTRNMYRAGQSTHFGQPLEYDFNLRDLWQRSIVKSEFLEKKKNAEAFNKQHRFKKRGVAILPVKFGISFTNKFMNQGGSLVHVYSDGSVLVNHGGIEMGQGLHTKVIQVAARAFGIPHENVHIEDTDTSKVANTQPSAASMSTDLYGMATLDACEQILARLAPIRARLGPEASFQQVVGAAYMSRIDLSAHGFYIVPNERCGYDFSKSVKENAAGGTAFNYFTTGVGCTEVELDVLTGDFHMLGVDVSMDLGASINPAIDVGQIEGAFMQGFGLFAMEELIWGDDGHPWVKRGHLFTRGPGAYKIPSMNDLPVDFKVWLDSGKKNRFAVHSSKAVGEPPLFLGASAFFAVKEAIYAAREDAGITGHFTLQSPVTPERARMACGDHLLQKVFTARGEDMGSYQPSGSF